MNENGQTDVEEKLRVRLEASAVVPFVGAGVSRYVSQQNRQASANQPAEELFPLWQDLLFRAANELNKNEATKKGGHLVSALLMEPAKPSDYLAAAKCAREYFGEPNWEDFLRRHIRTDKEKIRRSSLDLARKIWDLSRIIITTNYDEILTWSCPDRELTIVDIEDPKTLIELLNGEPRNRVVWHIHGHIDNPSEIVLDPESYAEVYTVNNDGLSKFEAARSILRTILATKSVLFIGFSMNDPYVCAQMRSVQMVFRGQGGPHFALIRRTEYEPRRDILNECGVHPILFDEFDELPGLIKRFSSWTQIPPLPGAGTTEIRSPASPLSEYAPLLPLASDYLKEGLSIEEHDRIARAMRGLAGGSLSLNSSDDVKELAAGEDQRSRVAAYIIIQVRPALSSEEAFVRSLSLEHKSLMSGCAETRPLWQALVALGITMASGHMQTRKDSRIKTLLENLSHALARPGVDTGGQCKRRCEHLLSRYSPHPGKPPGHSVADWARQNRARNPFDMGPLNWKRCLFDLNYEGGEKHGLYWEPDGSLKYR